MRSSNILAILFVVKIASAISIKNDTFDEDSILYRLNRVEAQLLELGTTVRGLNAISKLSLSVPSFLVPVPSYVCGCYSNY